MELNFVQSSEVFGKNTLAWETEFEATGDFNLHVERNKGGDILVYQRTAGSGYAIVEEFRGMDNKPAIDLDFTSVVYPKFVKIVSESQPTYATVTTDGEITEIKSQSKEIEVTSNGTMDITPDAGFSYLSAVKVKTNVAQSGGGSGTPLSKDMIYLDLSDYTIDDKTMIANYTLCAKYKDESGNAYFVHPIGFALESVSAWTDMDYFAVCGSLLIKGNEGNIPLIDAINLRFPDIPRITEEEFYNLNA